MMMDQLPLAALALVSSRAATRTGRLLYFPDAERLPCCAPRRADILPLFPDASQLDIPIVHEAVAS